MKPHPIYVLFRKNPPQGRGTTQSAAYWAGWEGNKRKYVPFSITWWAAKAGRDNRKEAV
jgi:hypothetical protein